MDLGLASSQAELFFFLWCRKAESTRKQLGDELDELLGGPRVWAARQFYGDTNRKDANKSPIVIHNVDIFEGKDYFLGVGGDKYAGRYTGLKLRLHSDLTMGFLAFSFHGENNSGGAEYKRKHCREFIAFVGDECVKSGFPAVIGGDWNTVLNGDSLPNGGDRFAVQLQRVDVFGPKPKVCRRQEISADPIDYFCIVRPLTSSRRAATKPPQVNSNVVLARPHNINADCFDHDPLCMEYTLKPPLGAAVVVPDVHDGDADAESQYCPVR